MTKNSAISLKNWVYCHRKGILKKFGCSCLFLVVFLGAVNVLVLLIFFPPRFVMNIVQKPIHKTIWKAEDWFDDPEVLKLCHAIEHQDIAEIESIIKSGVDVNARGKGNMPLLLWAYPAGEEVLENLLKNGADPNFVIESDYLAISSLTLGNTLLYMAVESNRNGEPKFKNYVDILLKYGANPDLGRIPPLVTASQYGGISSYNAFISLVNSGANLNAADDSGNGYPILSAATPENFDKLYILLESGATYDVNTIPGNTLQRVLYKRKNVSTLVLEPDQQKSFERCIQWLEDRGVSFDKPVSQHIGTIKPDPVRVSKPLK